MQNIGEIALTASSYVKQFGEFLIYVSLVLLTLYIKLSFIH